MIKCVPSKPKCTTRGNYARSGVALVLRRLWLARKEKQSALPSCNSVHSIWNGRLGTCQALVLSWQRYLNSVCDFLWWDGVVSRVGTIFTLFQRRTSSWNGRVDENECVHVALCTRQRVAPTRLPYPVLHHTVGAGGGPTSRSSVAHKGICRQPHHDDDGTERRLWQEGVDVNTKTDERWKWANRTRGTCTVNRRESCSRVITFLSSCKKHEYEYRSRKNATTHLIIVINSSSSNSNSR